MAKKAARAVGLTIDLARARAHWYAKQGLAKPVGGSLPDVLAATQWGRTLGGVDVYLAVRARVPGMKRADLESAVAKSAVQVIPAVRGCIYLVPRVHVPLALRVAEDQALKRLDAELTKAGATMKEVEGLSKQVAKTLAKGALSTDALRKALPEGAARSLGAAGKKVGLSSILAPALRVAEFAGAIERTTEGGRLDTQQYLWRATKTSPFLGAKLPADAAARHAELAGIFAAQCGPVTVDDFAAWSGLGKKDALGSLEARGLATVAVTGYAELAFVREEELPALAKPASPLTGVSFLSFEDSYLTHHSGPASVSDPKHHARKMQSWGMPGKSTLGEANHIQTRSIVLDGMLAGFWEYDAATRELARELFDPVPAKRKKDIDQAAADVAAFIADDLGHARSFSLDTDALVKKRADAVRKGS